MTTNRSEIWSRPEWGCGHLQRLYNGTHNAKGTSVQEITSYVIEMVNHAN